MKYINSIHRKHPTWGIENLMLHVSILHVAVYLVYLFRPAFVEKLYLNWSMVLKGEVWRLFTFFFIPPTFSMIFVLLVVFVYYSLGTTLEKVWGKYYFTAFYLLNVIGTIVAALITGGYYDGTYVNLSIFLAYAYMFPDAQFLIYFIIPVKAKYLAYLELAFLAYSLVRCIIAFNIAGIGAIIASLTGVIVFFGPDIINKIKAYIRRKKLMK